MCSTSTATSAVVEATKVSSELGDRIEKEAQSAYSEGRRVQKEKSSVIFPAPAAKRARRTSMDCAMAEDSVDDPGDKDGETPSVISDDHPAPPVGLPINGTVRPLSRGHCGTGPSTYRTGINRNGQFGSSNPSSNTGPKRVVIKNFRHRKSESSADQFESNWKILEEAVIAIQRKEKIHTGLEELYKTVENLCSYNLTNEMYLKLRQCILVHVTNELGRLLSESNAMLYFLQSLNNLWLEHCQQMVMIRSIFLFFDRTFVLQNSSILSLWDLGSEIFRDVIMKNDDVCNRSVGGILSLIETERQGSQIDRQLVKSLLRMMSSLSIYQTVFEKPFLDATKALYEVEGRNLSRDLDVSAYLKHVKRRLDEESNRVDYYLDFGTRKMLISITEQCFIVEHMDSFISRGLDTMILEHRKDDLLLIYSLLSRTRNGLSSLKQAFSGYIKKVGKALVMDLDRDKTLVSDLLEMKRKLDDILENCFDKNEKFCQAEKDAFDYFINTRPNKPAELVAKFMDSKLRSGNKEQTEEELEALMDQVIVIFRFIQGKDVFEAFYKKDLAKRLLLGRSASVDAEKAMLSKLKQECGAGFTTKLEGMFKDIEISKDLAVSFKQYLDHGGPEKDQSIVNNGHFEFSVNILTMGNWPSYEPMNVVIPQKLARYQELFKEYYVSKHSGRKLQWQHSLAQMLLRAQFNAKVVKELQVSMFQALVLLLFNDKTEWTYKEISDATKIEASELKRTLQSLACGKLRPIHKTPRGKDVSETDKFAFNTECNDKLFRIRIFTVQMKETAEEHSQTEEQIFQDRQYQIDAAIVRIMKMRKSLSHTLLISELFNQLRFPVKPVDLKKRIESLIEREYMCRDKEDANMYNYVA